MIWSNMGILCDPVDLPYGQGLYCQSPHAIQFEGYIRVYFTTRLRDGEQNFKSFPGFVDFSEDFSLKLRESTFPLLPLGPLGNFDEHGIFPFQPFLTRDGLLMATTTGWSRRDDVPAESAIGLATTSDRGKTFERVGGGPILAALHEEPFLIADGFVLEQNGSYHMFYIAGKKWLRSYGVTERLYKIRHAQSTNLIDWKRTNLDIISNSLGETECQALPTVIKSSQGWLMAFCFRDAFDFREDSAKGYKIGWATSRDLLNWERVDLEHSLSKHISGWDEQMQAYPNLFKNSTGTYLLYNGNDFGLKGFGIAKLEGEL
jgi:hypothetical protein